MTYTRPKTRHRAPPLPMGGIFDWIFGPNPSSQFPIPGDGAAQCLDEANAQLAPYEAKVNDLARNWTPTGFYTPGEIRQLISTTLEAGNGAWGALTSAASEPSASGDSIQRAVNDLSRAGQRSLDYLTAATEAERAGMRVVNAPGLKRWVTDTLATAQSSMTTAAVVGCVTPWWVGALETFQRAFDAAWSAARLVTGAVLAIGETAIKVAAQLPELAPLIAFGGILTVGYLVWTRIVDPR